MKKGILILAAGLIGLTSCNDIFNEDTNKADGSAPAITQQAPTMQSAYLSDQNIPIQFYIIDKDEVKDLEVHLTRTGNGELAAQEVFGFRKAPNNTGVTIDTAFSAAGLTAGNYQLSITAIDGRTNKTVKTTDFMVNKN